MYFRLHDERASRESRLARLREALPPEMYAFLTQGGTPWDAPLTGAAVAGLPVPGPEVCDVGRVERNPLALGARPLPSGSPGPAAVGSNAWALSPPRTRDGVAMVANDMHLGLSLPNTWVRLRVGVAGEGLDVTGITLPGTPAIVAGSNGHVAWGLTNSYGDWVDLVELEVDPDDPGRYRGPDGYRTFEEHSETIHVQGGEAREQVVRETIWGPVVDGDGHGGPRALRWLAHDARATDLGLLAMEGTRTVEQAMAVARRSGIPPQNLVVARLPGGATSPGRSWEGCQCGGDTTRCSPQAGPTGIADGLAGWLRRTIRRS